MESFVDAKGKADRAGGDNSAMNDIVGCLHSLTTLRAVLLNRLASGESSTDHQQVYHPPNYKI